MPISQPSYPTTTADLVTHVGTYADTKASAANANLTGIPVAPPPAADAATTQIATTAFVSITTILPRTADFQLDTSDMNCLNKVDSSSGRVVTFPTDAIENIPIGASGEIARWGTGAVTAHPAVGVLVRNAVQFAGTADRTISTQGASISWMKTAANEFWLSGALT